MQVLLNTDPHVDGSRAMADHLDAVVKDSLSRFADHLTRVEAHISDVTGSHASPLPNEIHCTLEARLNGRPDVVVKDRAATAHQAMNGAVAKLKRALSSTLDKLENHRAPAVALPDVDAELDARSP